MKNLAKRFKGDSIIWTVLIILSFYSLLAVYSSTGNLSMTKQGGNTEYYLLRQALLLVVGFLLMWLVHKIKWNIALQKSANVLLVISIILLISTFIFGIEVNGAKRWLRIPGIGLQFQTSDVVKILFVIYLATVLSKIKEEVVPLKQLFKKIYIPIWIVCGLILPMNFSTAAMLFLVSCVMIFISRVRMKSLFLFFGITAGAGILVVLLSLSDPEARYVPKRFTVWTNRITSFVGDDNSEDLNDDKTYQADQAKIAIIRGGVFGRGPGNSLQRNFLPHPDCDFIFAIIVEEYGIVEGAIPIIILYLILLFRGIKISQSSEKIFSSYLVFGIVFIYVIQAFIHIGVAVGLGPVTGQNLPMVSTGGTAMLTFCLAMGFVLSESRIINKRREEMLALQAEQEALENDESDENEIIENDLELEDIEENDDEKEEDNFINN